MAPSSLVFLWALLQLQLSHAKRQAAADARVVELPLLEAIEV